MLAPLAQVAWNGHRIHGVRPDHVLDIRPEPGWPGGRKGNAMAELWQKLRDEPVEGVIWMDPDIAADPHDLEQVHEQADEYPDAVHVACHKLWPASTGRDEWVWGFGHWSGDIPVMNQQVTWSPEWFALGMTYTPRRLLDLAAPQLPFWHYGQNDMGLSRIARDHRICIMPVLGAAPRHLHLEPGDGYLDWANGR